MQEKGKHLIKIILSVKKKNRKIFEGFAFNRMMILAIYMCVCIYIYWPGTG